MKTLFTIACFAVLGHSVSAGIIHPSSLAAGAKYRFAFVTSTTRDATSSDIADYDAFVNDAIDAADPSGLGAIDWRAWGSTATVDAIDHLQDPTGGWNASSVPIFLINTDSPIAIDFADLTDGVLGDSIFLDEFGTRTTSTFVATGTDFQGRRSVPLGSGPTVTVGIPSFFNVWTDIGAFPADSSYPLYGFSDVITKPAAPAVPEPSSMLLAILGMSALGAYRLRPRRKRNA